MFKPLCLTAALLCAVPVVQAQDPQEQKVMPDNPANRRIAADRYLEAADLKRTLREIVAASAEQVNPPTHRNAYMIAMNEAIDVDRLEDAAREAMVRNFNVFELNALADFYGSDHGQTAMLKMPHYLADVQPVIVAEVERARKKIEEKVERAKTEPLPRAPGGMTPQSQ